MKSDTQLNYEMTTITCACGNVIHTRSTTKNIHVEVCSACHPFFVGKRDKMKVAGRVEKFKKKYSRKKK